MFDRHYLVHYVLGYWYPCFPLSDKLAVLMTLALIESLYQYSDIGCLICDTMVVLRMTLILNVYLSWFSDI